MEPIQWQRKCGYKGADVPDDEAGVASNFIESYSEVIGVCIAECQGIA